MSYSDSVRFFKMCGISELFFSSLLKELTRFEVAKFLELSRHYSSNILLGQNLAIDKRTVIS